MLAVLQQTKKSTSNGTECTIGLKMEWAQFVPELLLDEQGLTETVRRFCPLQEKITKNSYRKVFAYTDIQDVHDDTPSKCLFWV